jgi:metal-dependent HD superfamily phosphatase/phosphodiesterase
MSEATRIAAVLLHDVGKHVARAARNVARGAKIEGALAAMMLRDVYETDRGKRASIRFEELAAELAAHDAVGCDTIETLDTVRASLGAIDALEARARSSDAEALAEIAQRARTIEDALRALARALAERDAPDEGTAR